MTNEEMFERAWIAGAKNSALDHLFGSLDKTDQANLKSLIQVAVGGKPYNVHQLCGLIMSVDREHAKLEALR